MASTSQQTNDWVQMQKQYWDGWFEQQHKFFGAEAAPSSPWAEFFGEWQKTVFGQQQGASAFQQHFAKHGQQFLDMMEQFYLATGQSKPLDQTVQGWVDQMQGFYESIIRSAGQPFDVAEGHKSFAHTMNKASQVWASLLEPLSTGDYKKAPFHAFDFLTAFPGLGYTSQKQEQLNVLYKNWVDYQSKSRAYDAAMAKIGLEAVQKFQEYLTKPPKDDEPLTSLKAVYAKWIDVCEEIYGEFAMSDEYIRLYGENVNALMAFKKEQDKLVDAVMEQMNLPTRKEIDSVHERVQALRRENIQLKKDVAELKAALNIKPAAAKPARKGKKK